MKWIRLQFVVLEILARIKLRQKVSSILFDPYRIASKFVRDPARLAAKYCRHTKGPSPKRDSECYFCWEHITDDEKSVEHRQCHNYFHEHCLDRWASFSEDAMAVCGVCRGPLKAGAEVVRVGHGRYEYRLSVIALVAKPSALLAAFFILACVLWWTTFDPCGSPRHVSAGLCGLLVFHATVWCVRMVVSCSEYAMGEYWRVNDLAIPDDRAVVRAGKALLWVKESQWAMLLWMLIQTPGLPTLQSQPAGFTAFLAYLQAYGLLWDVRAIESTAGQRAPPRWYWVLITFARKWLRPLVVW